MLGRVRHKVDKMNNRVRLEDQVRCFLYREKPGGGAKGGFRVAQSGSASCSGLQRPSTDGVRQINIKPGILKQISVKNHFCLENSLVNKHNTKSENSESSSNNNSNYPIYLHSPPLLFILFSPCAKEQQQREREEELP